MKKFLRVFLAVAALTLTTIGTVIDALRASYWEMGSGFKSVIEFAKELRHWIETDE